MLFKPPSLILLLQSELRYSPLSEVSFPNILLKFVLVFYSFDTFIDKTSSILMKSSLSFFSMEGILNIVVSLTEKELLGL